MLEEQLAKTQKDSPEEATIKGQIAKLKEAYGKIGEYKAPDYSGVVSAMGDARKVKQDVISSLGKEKQEIRDEELSGYGQAAIEAGRAIMSAPNIVAAIQEGMAAAGTVGKKVKDTARSKKKANKEKAQAITLEIANDKVAEQQFILSMKTEAETKKAQRILNKIKAGATISTAEANFMNAKSNRIKADADKIKAEYEARVQPKVYTEKDLENNMNALNDFQDDIVAEVMKNPPPGMDKGDVAATIKGYRKNPIFMRNLSQAFKNAEQAKSGLTRDTVIQQFVAAAITDPRYADLTKKSFF